MLGGGKRLTSRRALLGGTAAGLAVSALPRIAFGQSDITVTPVAGELVVLSGAGGNIVALPTSDGLVLVDSGAAAHTEAVLATLAELESEPVSALFNTHWHLDQVGGNAALGAAGATIHSHAKTQQRLRSGYYLPQEERYQAALPTEALPTETFFDSGSKTVGGTRIDFGYLIEAHTDGDIYVAFPELNVIAVGDVLAPERDPEFDWYGGGWLGGRVDALAMLLEISNADTRFVPGYGPVVDRDAVQAEHDTMLAFFELMVEHLRLGKSARDIEREGLLDGLGRNFDEPYRMLYDIQKGFWAHHNKLMHDIV